MAAAIHFINSLPGRFCGGLFGKSAACSTRCERPGVRLSRSRADMHVACQVSDQELRLPSSMQRKWQMCQLSLWLSPMRCRPYQVRPAAVPPLYHDKHSCNTRASMAAMSNKNNRRACNDALQLCQSSAAHSVVHFGVTRICKANSKLCCIA